MSFFFSEIDDTNVKVRAFEIDGTAPVSFELPLEDSNEDQTGANEAEMEEDGVADDDESEEENEEPKQRKGQKNQPKGILKKAGEQAKVTKVKNKSNYLYKLHSHCSILLSNLKIMPKKLKLKC